MRIAPWLCVAGAVAMGWAVPTPPADATDSGVVTLIAQDDLRSSYSFRSGSHSAFLDDSELHLEGTQVVFHRLGSNKLSFGYAKREHAQAVDLGATYVSPIVRVGDEAVKPPASIYHTLFRDGGNVAYREPLGRKVTYKDLHGFLNGSVPAGAGAIDPIPGHVYLLRFKDRVGENRFDRVVKLQVLEFIPDQRLTFRWAWL